MEHPSARSHIARTSVVRMEADMEDFAEAENVAVVPILKAVNANTSMAGIEYILMTIYARMCKGFIPTMLSFSS
jgi:hypothetical protein